MQILYDFYVQYYARFDVYLTILYFLLFDYTHICDAENYPVIRNLTKRIIEF